MRNRASQTRKQSKLEDIMWTPIKILGKARDFYMKGTEECVGKTGLDAVLVSGGTFPARLAGDEDLVGRGSLGASLKRRSDRVREEDGNRRRRVRWPAAEGRGCRVGLGRIDEDVACFFGEDVNVETFLSGPRNGARRNHRSV